MIHVTLGTMPTLLRGIVRSALQAQHDFAISDGQPAMHLSGERCDVLVVCARQGSAARMAFQQLLEPQPAAIVLLDPDGDSAAILRIGRDDRPLAVTGDLSRVIRAAASAAHGRTH